MIRLALTLVPILITLADRAPIRASRESDKHARRTHLVEALQTRARLAQAPLLRWLRAHRATQVKPLWLVNGIAATVTPAIAAALLRQPGVTRVALDVRLHLPPPMPATPATPDWNLQAIQAPAVWTLGVDGSGVVVANLDTGVDLGPDLQTRWRGGSDSWWDPWTHTSAPYDAIGHGTATMGLMVGGSALGVAPGARWIAAKIYDDQGNTSVSVIHEAFQWLLDSGKPDVVNVSFGLPTVNGCDTTFEKDFEALRAAGIVVVFAAGNAGPNVWTSMSPANNPDGFSAGAIDDTQAIASFSSRGASACTNAVFPDLVAPGVNVKTAGISLAGTPQYTWVSGTSFAAPHVAGTAALLLSKCPNAAVGEIEQTLRATAVDLGPAGPDDAYGHGLIDAWAAIQSLAGCP
jgi:subtilisin family serine protease